MPLQTLKRSCGFIFFAYRGRPFREGDGIEIWRGRRRRSGDGIGFRTRLPVAETAAGGSGELYHRKIRRIVMSRDISAQIKAP